MEPEYGKLRIKLITGYRGHGKRWGVLRYANGITLRVGSLALHIWRA